MSLATEPIDAAVIKTSHGNWNHRWKATESLTSPPQRSLCIHGLCQVDIDNMANNMKLYFDVLSPSTAQITLYNSGSKPIKKGQWAIYVCVLGVFDYDQLANNPQGFVPPGGSNLKMTHINGCLYKFEPLRRFKPFTSGKYLKVQVNTTSFLRARSDLAPNWYVAADGLKPRTISNTAGEDLSFVFSFQKLTWDPFSAKIVPDLGHAPRIVIPTPKKVTIKDKTRNVHVILGPNWSVYGEKGLENEAKFLAGISDICLFVFLFCLPFGRLPSRVLN